MKKYVLSMMALAVSLSNIYCAESDGGAGAAPQESNDDWRKEVLQKHNERYLENSKKREKRHNNIRKKGFEVFSVDADSLNINLMVSLVQDINMAAFMKTSFPLGVVPVEFASDAVFNSVVKKASFFGAGFLDNEKYLLPLYEKTIKEVGFRGHISSM